MATHSSDQQAYGHKILAIEPGGTAPIPVEQRHGRPRSLAWVWASPNLEFATVFVGALSVLYYGLDLATAILGIVLGNTLAASFHCLLTSWGPRTGLTQMVLSRRAFGFVGNLLPGGLNAVLVGVGWFAVNSVSGGLALATLTGLSPQVAVSASALISLALAFFGHNLIQAFQRIAFPVLAVIFALGLACLAPQADFGPVAEPIPGAFWVTVSTAFGYSIAWAPFAADYSRYLRPSGARPAGVFAALGIWVTNNLLQAAGAVAVTAVGLDRWNYDNPTASFTSLLPVWLGLPMLLAIWLGALCANALNLYSSGLSFAAIGVRLPTTFSRAAIVVAVGMLGAVLALVGLGDISSYESFLLVMAYWISPWLGVLMANRLYDRVVSERTFTDRHFRNPAGVLAMGLALIVSVLLFSNQSLYVGVIPSAFPEIGDVTFIAGFASAFGSYIVLRRFITPRISTQHPTDRTNRKAPNS